MPSSVALLAQSEDVPLIDDDVTLSQGLQALSVFVATIVASLLLRRALVRWATLHGSPHVGRTLGRFLSVVLIGVGLIYSLDTLGVRIGPLVGALGIGGIALAFAAQDMLANLISGVMISIRRPIRHGEQISTGEYEGTVEDVNLRTVEIRSYDGNTVLVPNKDVLQNPIVNYTRTPYRRTELVVGVAYDTDLEQARQVLLNAFETVDEVRKHPPPEAWVFEFGESSINIALRYWHPADIASVWRVRSGVAVSAKRALDEAGMTIPFPQRTLWFGPGNPALHVQHDPQQER